jgi:hydroxymethylglutaryl-CoA reductase
VAVGLAQNLAACRALVTEGIQRGHMSPHASNIALAAGATQEELPEVVARLIKDKAVRQDHAERVIAEFRSAKSR